jgi:hypothetical protein
MDGTTFQIGQPPACVRQQMVKFFNPSHQPALDPIAILCGASTVDARQGSK